jgi:hypothetical protein
MAAATIHANAISAYYAARSIDDPDPRKAWEHVLRSHDDALVPLFELRLLAGDRLRQAANSLRDHIISYEKRARDSTADDPAFDAGWAREWPVFRDAVMVAAREELAVG